MKNSGSVWVWDWRRSIVDVLIGLATVVAFAATAGTGQMLYMVLIMGALVGIGLMLEPKVTAQSGSDVAPQSLRSPAELAT